MPPADKDAAIGELLCIEVQKFLQLDDVIVSIHRRLNLNCLQFTFYVLVWLNTVLFDSFLHSVHLLV